MSKSLAKRRESLRFEPEEEQEFLFKPDSPEIVIQVTDSKYN